MKILINLLKKILIRNRKNPFGTYIYGGFGVILIILSLSSFAHAAGVVPVVTPASSTIPIGQTTVFWPSGNGTGNMIFLYAGQPAAGHAKNITKPTSSYAGNTTLTLDQLQLTTTTLGQFTVVDVDVSQSFQGFIDDCWASYDTCVNGDGLGHGNANLDISAAVVPGGKNHGGWFRMLLGKINDFFVDVAYAKIKTPLKVVKKISKKLGGITQAPLNSTTTYIGTFNYTCTPYDAVQRKGYSTYFQDDQNQVANTLVPQYWYDIKNNVENISIDVYQATNSYLGGSFYQTAPAICKDSLNNILSVPTTK